MPRKTTVGVAASPLFPDPPEKQPYSEILLKNITQKESIPNDIIRYHSESFDGKLERYYEFGRDKYIYGLPHGYGMSTPLFNTVHQDISNVIAGIEGQSIQLLNVDIVTDTNADSEAKFFMRWYREYVPSTNQVNPAILGLADTIVPTYSNALVTTTGRLRITYNLDIGGTHVEEVDFRFYAPGIPVIIATYRLDGEDYTWVYAPVTNEFPTLTKVVLQSDTFEYYPIVPIRYNRKNIAEERESFAYNDNREAGVDRYIDASYTSRMSERNKNIRALLKTIGLSLDDLNDAVTSSPDIGYVDDAFLTNCILITDESQEGLRYMFEYFNTVALTQVNTKTEFAAWKASPTTSSPVTQIIIKDSAVTSEAEYNHNLIFNYIDVEDITASGTVGTYTSSWSTHPSEEIQGHYLNNDEFIIEYQLTATTRTKLTVKGIRQLGYINKGNGERLVTETTLDEAHAVTDPIQGMFVPLCRNIISGWDTEDATDIGYRSFHVIIQSVVVTKVKWYQTGIFKVLLVIVAAVVSVWLQNPAAFQTLVGAIFAVAYTIAINLVLAFLFELVLLDMFVWLVDQIGGELATILATAAAITAIAYGQGDTALQFADELMAASNVLFKAINKHTLNEFDELKTEMEDFITDVKEAQEEIDKAEDLLSTQLEALDIVEQQPLLIHEDVDSFIHRTIHIGNPGVLSLDIAENYFDNMLTLPKGTI